MGKIMIKSATISQGNTTCEHCGTRIRNLVTITAADDSQLTVGTTCFRKIFGFTPKRNYDGTIPIADMCGGCPVKTIECRMHLDPRYLKTVNLTVDQIFKLAELWKSGIRVVDRIEWNRPYYWEFDDFHNGEFDPYMQDSMRWHGGDMVNQ